MCLIAAAAFDAAGDVIGGIGDMTSEIVTALPLPRTLLWAYFARHAYQLGAPKLARRGLSEVQKAILAITPSLDLWQQSPLQRLRLVQKHCAYRAAAELRSSHSAPDASSCPPHAPV